MGNYEQLKTAIADVIKANGNQEITGNVLQGVLLTLISNMSAGATFAGVATKATVPPTADQNLFYLAAETGVFPNFNAIEALRNEITVFHNKDGVWSKTAIKLTVEVEVKEGKRGDLEVADENGYVIVRFIDGHIVTKNFDSRNLANIGIIFE